MICFQDTNKLSIKKEESSSQVSSSNLPDPSDSKVQDVEKAKVLKRYKSILMDEADAFLQDLPSNWTGGVGSLDQLFKKHMNSEKYITSMKARWTASIRKEEEKENERNADRMLAEKLKQQFAEKKKEAELYEREMKLKFLKVRIDVLKIEQECHQLENGSERSTGE